MNRDLRAKIGRVDRLYGINSSMEKPPGRYHHDANFCNSLKRRFMPAFPVSILLSLQLTSPVVACLLHVHEQASPVVVNSHRIRARQSQFDRFQAKNLI